MPVYLFFNKNGEPVAAFIKNTKEEAIERFTRLYRKSWEDCEREYYSVSLESEWAKNSFFYTNYQVEMKPKVLSEELMLELAAIKNLRDYYNSKKRTNLDG